MTTKKERMYQQIEKHGRDLIKAFALPESIEPIALCKKLRRLESEANRKMVEYCNGDIQGEEIDAYQEKLEARVGKIIGAHNLPTLYVNRDPRGYTLKLTERASATANIHKDWGGYGILAPDFNE